MTFFSSLLVIFVSALYVSPCVAASVDNKPFGVPSMKLTDTLSPARMTPVISIRAGEIAATSAPAAAPHIALILPIQSPVTVIAKSAESVKQGFLAAARIQPTLPIRIYETTDESKEVAALYRLAESRGAVAVAGPLTRDGVLALTASAEITLPTLALNAAQPTKTSRNFYSFGLPLEADAAEIARLARQANLRRATVIRTQSTGSVRLATTFAKEWQQLGGQIAGEVVFAGKMDTLARISQSAGSLIFLATEAEEARVLHPYLNPDIPVYATSRIFRGNGDKLLNFDLNDIRFADMPWLLQPDHPAVMTYPARSNGGVIEADMERMYALGIDACRLLQIASGRMEATALPLDGVTGQLTLGNGLVQRKQTPAFFKHGLGLTPETLAALNAARAAAREAAGKLDAGGLPLEDGFPSVNASAVIRPPEAGKEAE